MSHYCLLRNKKTSDDYRLLRTLLLITAAVLFVAGLILLF